MSFENGWRRLPRKPGFLSAVSFARNWKRLVSELGNAFCEGLEQ
jgi:hypothetical protein